jgi:membrane associated rhomboid family serine protease
LKAWLAVCALLAGGSIAVAWMAGVVPPADELATYPLAWNAAGWLARPWTLWTSAWVHTSAGNLGGNLLAIAALAVLGAALRAGRAAAAALLVAWPAGVLALLLWPQVTSYGGLGGPIHAAAMVLATVVARRPSLKPLSPLLFAGMGLKLIAEQGWSHPVAFDPSWGFNVVYAGHLTSALAGVACGWLAGWFAPTPGRER